MDINSIVSSRFDSGLLTLEQHREIVRLPKADSNASDQAKANEAKKDLPQYETPVQKNLLGIQASKPLVTQRSARNLYRNMKKEGVFKSAYQPISPKKTHKK